MKENLELGFIILLTGIVVVFAVLVLLIAIIKLYSTIVYNVQNRGNKKDGKDDSISTVKTEPSEVKSNAVEKSEPVRETDGSIPGEIIAAIAAAVEVIFGQGNVKITSVKRSAKRRSAWKSAGMAENTRSF